MPFRNIVGTVLYQHTAMRNHSHTDERENVTRDRTALSELLQEAQLMQAQNLKTGVELPHLSRLGYAAQLTRSTGRRLRC